MIGPPKTTIVGIIAAALGYKEEKYINLIDNIKVGMIIDKIQGITSDISILFNYKKSPPERTPVTREILIKPEYTIFVTPENETLIDEIYNAIKHPKFTIYLGISDFIARIFEISKEHLRQIKERTFSCISPYYPNNTYTPRLKEDMKGTYIPPKVYRVPKNYKLKGISRKPTDLIDVIMFYGYEIEYNNLISAYKTSSNQNIILM